MSTIAEVKLWGGTIGAVTLNDGERFATFQYDPAFVGSGIEVSPLMMPVTTAPYSFPALSVDTFHGLPGMLSDSLPDRFGNALIDSWLARQGRQPQSFNAVERLCYTGSRGMGALEFVPSTGPVSKKETILQVDQLVVLASEVLTERNTLNASMEPEAVGEMEKILRVGTSAGGARAKAVIAWNPQTNEVRSGQADQGSGFEYWLIKFDGVAGNKDKELADPLGYGVIEYAYHLMAKDCGIAMNPCRLFEEGGRRHFMTKRFDRTELGGKLHMQSLGAIAHLDYNQAGAHSYEQAFQIAKRLGCSTESLAELYRRMVFNIIARNQDDHVKNIAFLMNRDGQWSLAPAYDLTFNYNPYGRWTGTHQMSFSGKRDGFTYSDLVEGGKVALMKAGMAKQIVHEVSQAVKKWAQYADGVGADLALSDEVSKHLRFDLVE